MSIKNTDILREKQDKIAREMGYIDAAREELEEAFLLSTQPAGRRKAVSIAAAAATLAAAASLLWMVTTSSAIEATVEGQDGTLEVGSWVSSGKDRSLTISFSDGSTIVLAKSTEVRVQALRETGAHLLLERGAVNVSVVHREKTDWQLDAGPYQIMVTGTRFKAEWTSETKAFTVGVKEGTVAVDGPLLADGKFLSAGDKIKISLLDKVAEINKKDTIEKIVSRDGDDQSRIALERPVKAASTETASAVLPTTATVPEFEPLAREPAQRTRDRGPVEAHVSWQALAARGDYREAVMLVERRGFNQVIASESLHDLMLLGDAARLAKVHHRAIQAYKAVRARYRGTAESQRAAFALGRIAFEARGRYLEAADWFKVCYRDNRKGTLAREAFGRLMEALDRAGDAKGARATAAEYNRLFSGGPHGKLAKEILSKTDQAQ